MGKVTRLETIAVKLENTYNVENEPDPATDAVQVSNPTVSFTDVRRAARSPNKPTFGELKGVPAGELLEVTCIVEMRGSGVAGTAPEFDKLMQLSGHSAATVGSTVVYAPIEQNVPSGTIDYFLDGGRMRLSGARGGFSFSGNVGEIGQLTYTAKGHFVEAVDEVYPAFSYLDTVPPALLGVTATLDGFAPEISAFSLEQGNTISTPSSATSPDGYGQIVITDRLPTGSFDPELTDVATKDWVGDFRTGRGQPLTFAAGSVAGNRFQWALPEIYFTDIPSGERDGIRTLDVSFSATGEPPYRLIMS